LRRSNRKIQPSFPGASMRDLCYSLIVMIVIKAWNHSLHPSEFNIYQTFKEVSWRGSKALTRTSRSRKDPCTRSLEF